MSNREQRKEELLNTNSYLIKAFLVVAGMLVFVSFPLNVYALAITVPNGSFESPDFADGSGLVQITPGIYFDWNYDQVPVGGQFGIIDSNDSRFPNTTGDGLLPGPADGQQYAILGTPGGFQSTSITNVSPLGTLQNDLIYTLSLAAGNELTSQFSSHTGSLEIALLADNTVLAQNSISYATIPLGSFELLSTYLL
jgi:HpiC1 cyclase